MRLILLAILLVGATACSMTPRQRAHWEFMSEFYYVDQSGADRWRITAEGPVYGDCDDAALSFGYRQGWACKPWHVRLAGTTTHHLVCRYPDGYYFDNRTLLGSDDPAPYVWIQEIPVRTVPVH